MNAKYLLGLDIGSSSVKVALVDIETGAPLASAFSPSAEMAIDSPRPGFAEQDPEIWWRELGNAIQLLKKKFSYTKEEVAAVGISYQMHGLVCIDRNHQVIRPSIIWCDSRAVEIGNKAFKKLGTEYCLNNFLNSPGNFTASKLAWVKENEPDKYQRIYKMLLPGDYIACRLTGIANTTVSGLSEGILWNFQEGRAANELLEQYEIDLELLAELVPNFGVQGEISAEGADWIGVKTGTPVSYRSGDQPNNAFSLNVLEPGEIAATAGTSGVVYGVSDRVNADPESRVNTFVHVNHSDQDPRYGILMCINGTGSLNSWLRKSVFRDASYEQMNAEAAEIKVGSEGLRFFPFGNGAERVLGNKDPGASMSGLQFNTHGRGHLARAAQEGIAFSFRYGISVMKEMGMSIHTIRAGYANMFQSSIFSSTLANATGCTIDLLNTDGAVGAARGAGVGAGIYPDFKTAFSGMTKVKTIVPEEDKMAETEQAYRQWEAELKMFID